MSQSDPAPLGLPPPPLQIEDLLLRPVTLADPPALQAQFSNWNVVKWIGGVPWPYPEDGAQRYIALRLSDAVSKELYCWGLFLKGMPETLIGAIEHRFFADEDENRGVWLAEPYWGQGLMTKAAAVTQDFVFFTLEASRLLVRSLMTNAASKTFKEKTGARRIGTSTGSYLIDACEEDVWEITRESWRLAREGLAFLSISHPPIGAQDA